MPDPEPGPPDSFFKSGPIGRVYYIQTWFRYYLQQWIEDHMRELEAKEGVYSLDGGYEIAASKFDSPGASVDRTTPNISGDFTDTTGRTWSADVTPTNTPMDVSKLTLAWVAGTDDPLFCDLTRRDRHILYLYFAREQSLGRLPRASM